MRRIGVQDPENMSLGERLKALAKADKEAIGIYDAEIEQLKRFIEDSERVCEAGGLHVIGSERHESRRIDNQLRGRAGRQGEHEKAACQWPTRSIFQAISGNI